MTQQTKQMTTILCDRCAVSKTYPADCSIENEKDWSTIDGSRKSGAAVKGLPYNGVDLCPDCTAQFEAWWSSVGPK